MKKKQMVAVIVLVVAMLVMALPAYAADPKVTQTSSLPTRIRTLAPRRPA